MNKEKKAPPKPGLLKVVVYVLPACLIILSLFYYWFIIADLNEVFLYYHNMGPRVPDTSPFSFVTAGRYWMARLVASGFTLLVYFLANFIGGIYYSNNHWISVWSCFSLFGRDRRTLLHH